MAKRFGEGLKVIEKPDPFAGLNARFGSKPKANGGTPLVDSQVRHPPGWLYCGLDP
jgi:hypothetical protein